MPDMTKPNLIPLQYQARSAAIHPAHPFSADSQEESGLEANLDLHQFGDRATGLCFCGD